MKYCSTGIVENQALEDLSALRDIMTTFMDNQILQRTKKKLQESKTEKELFQVPWRADLLANLQEAQSFYKDEKEEWGRSHDLPVWAQEKG